MNKQLLFCFIMSARLENPACNFYFWKHITFQVTEFDQNDMPTHKITSSRTCRYTTTLNANQRTKLGINVRSHSSVPVNLLLTIRCGNHTSSETITLEDDAYKHMAYVNGDCSMEITHHQQKCDNYWLHVVGIDKNPDYIKVKTRSV